MKLLKQVALVTAVAAASGSAFAMEALTDEALSEKTGQDGITITITPDAGGITIDKLFIHDNDGVGDGNFGVTTSSAGAIVLGAASDPGLKVTGGNIALVIDADGNSASPVLNVAATLNGPTKIEVGKISVGASGTAPTLTSATAKVRRGTTGTDAEILGGLDLNINGNVGMNIQLGNQPQGAMVKVNATVNGGISIDNLSVTDADGGTNAGPGSVTVEKLKVVDADAANLTLTQNIDIDATNGLEIEMVSSGMDLYVDNIGLGGSSIGDVEIQGLKMGTSKIAIKGH